MTRISLQNLFLVGIELPVETLALKTALELSVGVQPILNKQNLSFKSTNDRMGKLAALTLYCIA